VTFEPERWCDCRPPGRARIFGVTDLSVTLAAPAQTPTRDARAGTPLPGTKIAEKQPDEFYVVLTNVSKEAQLVWEYWNSWGYQTLSFEITLSHRPKIIVLKRSEVFTRNFPSTFLIPPGEHQVYPIRLDKSWTPVRSFPNLTEMMATVKAVYDVPATDESLQYRVWAGRVESDSYEFALRHW